ncbi:MAG: shikimate kinase [Sphaerochaeta sp.]
MGRIFLCGIKHSGKTTLGRLLAQRLHIAWVDLDEYIEEAIEENIRSFYQREGHTAFQALEVRYLQQILAEQSDECIISLGGGAADNEALMTLLKDSGTLIYLWVEESELLKRIIATGIPPFLDPANVEASFHELFQRRNSRYSKDCNHLIQLPFDQDPLTNVEAILEVLGR